MFYINYVLRNNKRVLEEVGVAKRNAVKQEPVIKQTQICIYQPGYERKTLNWRTKYVITLYATT
jgi:hypothetical protein